MTPPAAEAEADAATPTTAPAPAPPATASVRPDTVRTAARKRRRRLWLRWLLLTPVALLGVAAALVLAAAVVLPEILRSELVSTLGGEGRFNVEIGAIHYRFPLTAWVENVRVRDPDHPELPPVLVIRRAGVRLSELPWPGRKVRLERIRVSDWDFTVSSIPGGGDTLSRWLAALQGSAKAKGAEERRTDLREVLEIEEVILSHGRVGWLPPGADPADPTQVLAVDDISLHLDSRGRDADHFDLKFSGELGPFGRGEVSGGIDLARLVVDVRSPQLRIELTPESIAKLPAPVRERLERYGVSGVLAIESGRATLPLEDLSASQWALKAALSDGTVRLAGAGVDGKHELAVRGAAADVSADSASGIAARLRGSVQGEPASATMTARPARLAGRTSAAATEWDWSVDVALADISSIRAAGSLDPAADRGIGRWDARAGEARLDLSSEAARRFAASIGLDVAQLGKASGDGAVLNGAAGRLTMTVRAGGPLHDAGGRPLLGPDSLDSADVSAKAEGLSLSLPTGGSVRDLTATLRATAGRGGRVTGLWAEIAGGSATLPSLGVEGEALVGRAAWAEGTAAELSLTGRVRGEPLSAELLFPFAGAGPWHARAEVAGRPVVWGAGTFDAKARRLTADPLLLDLTDPRPLLRLLPEPAKGRALAVVDARRVTGRVWAEGRLAASLTEDGRPVIEDAELSWRICDGAFDGGAPFGRVTAVSAEGRLRASGLELVSATADCDLGRLEAAVRVTFAEPGRPADGPLVFESLRLTGRAGPAEALPFLRLAGAGRLDPAGRSVSVQLEPGWVAADPRWTVLLPEVVRRSLPTFLPSGLVRFAGPVGVVWPEGEDEPRPTEGTRLVLRLEDIRLPIPTPWPYEGPPPQGRDAAWRATAAIVIGPGRGDGVGAEGIEIELRPPPVWDRPNARPTATLSGRVQFSQVGRLVAVDLRAEADLNRPLLLAAGFPPRLLSRNHRPAGRLTLKMFGDFDLVGERRDRLQAVLELTGGRLPVGDSAATVALAEPAGRAAGSGTAGRAAPSALDSPNAAEPPDPDDAAVGLHAVEFRVGVARAKRTDYRIHLMKAAGEFRGPAAEDGHRAVLRIAGTDARAHVDIRTAPDKGGPEVRLRLLSGRIARSPLGPLMIGSERDAASGKFLLTAQAHLDNTSEALQLLPEDTRCALEASGVTVDVPLFASVALPDRLPPPDPTDVPPGGPDGEGHRKGGFRPAVQLTGGRVSTAGDGRLLGNLSLRAEFDAAEGRLRLDDVRAELLGGRVAGEAAFDLFPAVGGQPTVAGRLTLEDVRAPASVLEDSDIIRGIEFSGGLEFNAPLSGSARWGPDQRVRLRDGRLTLVHIDPPDEDEAAPPAANPAENRRDANPPPPPGLPTYRLTLAGMDFDLRRPDTGGDDWEFSGSVARGPGGRWTGRGVADAATRKLDVEFDAPDLTASAEEVRNLPKIGPGLYDKFRPAGRLSAKGRFRIRGGAARNGGSDVRWNADLGLRDVTGKLIWDSLPLTGFKARIRIFPSVAIIENASAGLYRGRLESDAIRIRYKQPDHIVRYAGDLRAEGVSLGELYRAGFPDAGGDIRGRLKGQVILAGDERGLPTLKLSGGLVEVADARLYGIPLFSGLGDALAGAFAFTPLRAAFRQEGRLLFRFEEQRLIIVRAVLSDPLFRVVAEDGSVRFTPPAKPGGKWGKEMSMRLFAVPLGRVIDVPGLNLILRPAVDELWTLGIPIRIGGDPTAPTVRRGNGE
jgi:hypothetical protein